MPKYDVPEGYMTVTQAARIVGLLPNTMRYHIDAGNIEAKGFNEGTPRFCRLISQEALDAFRRKREPKPEEDHLYEIICICCGKTDVLFSTHSLLELSNKYVRMVENDHKLVRVRLDGEPLLIFESDKLGYSYHPRVRKGIRYGKGMERSQGSAERHLPRHEQGGVQHGQESPVLRGGADGAGQDDQLRGRAPAGAPEEPVPAVPQSGQGAVQGGAGQAERAEHPGVPSRPGRKRRVTDEERRLKKAENTRRWRHNNPERAKEVAHNYYATHKEQFREKNRLYWERHLEKMREYNRQYKRKKREEARHDTGTKGE